MSNTRLDTLFYPFESGRIDGPGKDGATLFLGAESGFRAGGDEFGKLTAIQGFRPDYLALKASGTDVLPVAEDNCALDCVLVLAGRNRHENENRIRMAVRHACPGALIVVSGAKSDGAASMLKRLDALMPLDGREAKYHGGVGWFRRPDDAGCQVLLDALMPPEPALADGRFHTGIGTFSAGEVDAGSRLLADSLPENLKGAAADFGAGWGYLSARLVETPTIKSIDLYEASYEALEAAKSNLRDVAPRRAINFHWQDLLVEAVTPRYDLIIMNPPFHRGRAAEPDIGVSMIRTALASLKRGGKLYMVANRGLPYEAVLEAGSHEHGELARDERYRVLWALK